MNRYTAIQMAAAITLLAGAWLFASPWLMSAYYEPSAWNSWIVALIVMAFAAIRLATPAGTLPASLLNALLGAWIFVSPWVYSYVSVPNRFANSLVIGVLVMTTAGVAALVDLISDARPPHLDIGKS